MKIGYGSWDVDINGVMKMESMLLCSLRSKMWLEVGWIGCWMLDVIS